MMMKTIGGGMIDVVVHDLWRRSTMIVIAESKK